MSRLTWGMLFLCGLSSMIQPSITTFATNEPPTIIEEMGALETVSTPTLEWSGSLVIEAGSNSSLLEDVRVVSPGTVGDYKIDVRTGSLNTRKVGTYQIEYVIKYGENHEKEVTQSREVIVKDTTAPTLTLKGDEVVILSVGEEYQELGAVVTDNSEDAIQYRISNKEFSTKIPGIYTVTYTAVDGSGNTTSLSREIHVRDTIAPTITLNGSNYIVLTDGAAYKEPGYAVSDNYDKNVQVTVTGDDFNHLVEGTYTIKYTAKDSTGNEATVSRVVVVQHVPENLKPSTPNDKEETPDESEKDEEQPKLDELKVIGTGFAKSSVNVRKGSGTQYEALGKLSTSQEVEVYGLENGWYQINFNGQLGYVRQDFLTYTDLKDKDEETDKPSENLKVIGTGIAKSEVNVRTGSGTSFEAIGKLAMNQEVEVYGLENGWYKLNFNGRIGFVRQDYITFTELEESEKEEETQKEESITDTEVESNESTNAPLLNEEEGDLLVEEELVEVQPQSNSEMNLLNVLKGVIIVITTSIVGLIGVLIYLKKRDHSE